MRRKIWLFAFLLALAAGLGSAWEAAPYINDYLKLAPLDRKFKIVQGVIVWAVVYLLYSPIRAILTLIFPHRRSLIPCPDCDRLVSRLAKLCPGCGRPLTPQSGSE